MSDESNATHKDEQESRSASDAGVGRIESNLVDLALIITNDVRLPLETLSRDFQALQREMARERADRQARCPYSETHVELDQQITALGTRLKIVERVGGAVGTIFMAAIVIPGISWAAKAIGRLLASG
jgi:hypothetical protein